LPVLHENQTMVSVQSSESQERMFIAPASAV